MWFSIFVSSPLTWIGLTVTGFSLSALYFDVSVWPQIAREALSFCTDYHFGKWAVVLVFLSAVRAVVCFQTSKYTVDDTGVVVQHGLFSPYSRRGVFVRDTNGVAFGLISDADPGQSILQMLTNTGCIRIVTITGEIVYLPFVHNPQKVRAHIMKRSGIHGSKPFTRVVAQ